MANNNNNNYNYNNAPPLDELEQQAIQIQYLVEITGVDEALAHFMLEESEYDLNRALSNFFNEQQYEQQQEQQNNEDGGKNEEEADDDNDNKNDQSTSIEEPAKKQAKKKKMMEIEYGKAGTSSTKMGLREDLNKDEPLKKPRLEVEQTKCDSVAAELYCTTMKELIFKTIPFYGANNNELCIPYHFATSLNNASTAAAAGEKFMTARLAKEIASFHETLPVSAESTIFVRACEERLDVMKALIIGPIGTPYANGCFEFDVFFPSNYPFEPMRMNFETTGNKTIRFNPNLYNNGYICLSILNTWEGEPWNAGLTLAQVLISIQGLVFVDKPYFNEPGFENMRNTPNGEIESCQYNAKIRQMCLQWAMLQQIKNPPKAFFDVIECHFWLKSKEICAQVEEWIEDCKGLVDARKVPKTYLDGLKTEYEKLKTTFSSMKCPSALQQNIPIDNKLRKPKKTQ